MFIDYLTLKLIWWLFVVVLLVGFVLLGGFDLGVGALLPFVGRTDTQRRVLLNAIGPTWEGNQVWFITAGGALFAAWPVAYATAFSGFYWAMLLVLFALFFRPVRPRPRKGPSPRRCASGGLRPCCDSQSPPAGKKGRKAPAAWPSRTPRRP